MSTNAVYLVKIAESGMLTIEIPQMAGKYMVVEQHDGKLLITPFDLERETKVGAIARKGRQWTLLGTEAHSTTIPEA